MSISKTVDAYIASSPPEARPILEAIRKTVRRAAPHAEERISYRMPAFFFGGVLVYFAAFKKHIGLYPPVRDKSLKPLVARYAGPKGNLQFPLAERIPLSLISKIVKARLEELRGKAEKTKKTKKTKSQPLRPRRPAGWGVRRVNAAKKPK
ncbi:MAG TPA: DUF1801 domain-containing protein [Steroidobacteraceae bacterium]|jgi:uncharacterized protein YdhG (YjbR/CyaY superfamily)|nr:DUF1801 domain-containing protein [Steroidobacteraceae bacterium]